MWITFTSLTCFALVHLGQSQSYYGSSNSAATTVGAGSTSLVGGGSSNTAAPSVTSTAATATTTSSFGSTTLQTFTPSGTGDCTNATDSVYLAQVQTLAVANNALDSVFHTNPNAKTDNSSGFFLGIIIQIGQQRQTLYSSGITGVQCVALNTAVYTLISTAQAHASDVVPQPLTGENYYQYLLQVTGGGWNTVFATGKTCQYATNPGKWLQLILTANQNIDAIRAVIQNNDTSQNCQTASNAIAATLLTGLTSVNGTISTRSH